VEYDHVAVLSVATHTSALDTEFMAMEIMAAPALLELKPAAV
jgi:hypothetical protein